MIYLLIYFTILVLASAFAWVVYHAYRLFLVDLSALLSSPSCESFPYGVAIAGVLLLASIFAVCNMKRMPPEARAFCITMPLALFVGVGWAYVDSRREVYQFLHQSVESIEYPEDFSAHRGTMFDGTREIYFGIIDGKASLNSCD